MQLDRNSRTKENARCPYCQTPIHQGENTVVCSWCKMPHHLGCWMENGQCTTYGCRGHRMANPSMLAHRKQQLPIIDISFDEMQKNAPGNWFRAHVWKVAVLLVFLLGSSYYLYRFL